MFKRSDVLSLLFYFVLDKTVLTVYTVNIQLTTEAVG